MPKEIPDFDFTIRDPHRFDEVLDGRKWQIGLTEYGAFNSYEALRAAVKYTCARRGLQVRTKIVKDAKGKRIGLAIQSYQPAEVRKLREASDG